MSSPAYHDPFANYRELTLRGMVLGALITVVFTASNVYLGLKVGLTFASTIPAAVISMAVLKFAHGSNILENNLVQTEASAAGTISSVIFVLPGLLMVGYWSGFPFWQTTLLCTAGGILGVIFTVPLRLAMVVHSDLPYPEGVAAAEILKVGCHDPNIENSGAQQGGSGVKEIITGGALAGIVSLCTNGLRLAADSASYWFKSGAAIFQAPMGFSFALLGAGYLVGLAGGIAILIGLVLTWFGIIPYLSATLPQPPDTDMAGYAMSLWKNNVRFIGAGTIAIAAFWTLITLFKPMVEGMKLSIAAFSGKGEQAAHREDLNLSPHSMLLWIAIAAVILVFCFHRFVADASLGSGMAWTLVIVCTLLTILIGFLVAAACGYMAGLIGSSSSPISGIGIIATIIISLILLMIGEAGGLFADEGNRQFLLALTLFCGTAIIAAACISNDNLQDLKTGYLLRATPWRQQIALIIGVVVGAIVIAPVLELLYQSYGFAGAMPREGMDPTLAMNAPQATIMTTIAKGIFSHDLQWGYIFTGMGIGAAAILFNLWLKKATHGRMTVPPLAIGMGIYLPPMITPPLIVGAFLAAITNHLIRKRYQDSEPRLKNAERVGTLFAAGLIVGESLIGVILAFIIVISVTSGGSDAPLAITPANWGATAEWLGLAAFIACVSIFARHVLIAARQK
ncbi:OPT family oligopeptide transporter [Cardiobacterium hominis]|uniref:OPT family oligopeptide transporter n=1 Tax=Cardiobacterium hominis TaxID=2718 RepID=UPI0028D37F87|nr:oligopeptide transporter, OPT family [Cardiobacterium hominis]